jgi:hypothetical protein
MQHLLYTSAGGTVNVESDTTLGKFDTDKIPVTSASTLTIHRIQKQDSAVDYCVFWRVHGSRHLEPSHSVNVHQVLIHYFELEKQLL